MKELQELRNEVLSLRNMGEITKQTESILLNKINALNEAINYTHSCTELKAECECNKGKNGEGMDLVRDFNKAFRSL